MKTLKIAGALAAMTALASVASADGNNNYTIQIRNSGSQMNILQKGVYSASASGSYFTSDGNHTTNLNVAVSQFLTDNIEGRLGIMYTDVNGSNNTGLFAGARYYFDPSQDKSSVPFVGAFYQYNTGSGLNSNSLGLEGGIQYFLAPNVSVTPAVVWTSTHSTGGGGNTTSFGVQFGLTYWFKP